MQTQKFSALHQAARNFAEAGIPIFPCEVGGKKPATAHGYQDATTDLGQIDAWWNSRDYNIGMCPNDAGWCVIDLDPGASAVDLPVTYEVRTPRGGSHLYYDGELPTSASKLGDHIDTRGVGGYVLVPPSIVDGKPYKVLHDRDIAPLPGWIKDRLAEGNQRMRATVEELDLPGNVARGRTLLLDLVERGDIAISGQGGNTRTYKLACELSSLGISPGVSFELLMEIWNPHCVPPWEADELGVVIENASRYAQNEPGAFAVAPALEVFGPALDKLDLTPEPARLSRFHFKDEAEQEKSPDTKWFIKDLIPDATTVLIVGPKANFKSFVAQEILLASAANVETFGTMPVRTGPTFYGAHEGRGEIEKQRRRAWKLARGVEAAIPFYVAPAPHIIRQEECEEFREQIRVRLREGSAKIAGIVLDTVAKCMTGMDGNSDRDAGLFVEFCDSLLYEFECPIIALHHTKKDNSPGARGSGALEAGFGTVIDTRRKGKALEVQVRYHKDAEEREQPWTFVSKVIGPSLVFFPTNLEEHKALTQEEDHLAPKKIGAALQALNAYGPDQGVTTDVLAAQITPQIEGQPVADHHAFMEKTARQLNIAARSRLAAYCERKGRTLTWFLPAPVPAGQPSQPK